MYTISQVSRTRFFGRESEPRPGVGGVPWERVGWVPEAIPTAAWAARCDNGVTGEKKVTFYLAMNGTEGLSDKRNRFKRGGSRHVWRSRWLKNGL